MYSEVLIATFEKGNHATFQGRLNLPLSSIWSLHQLFVLALFGQFLWIRGIG